MASYKFDPERQCARIFWRIGGRHMTRVIGCATERDAQRACSRIEDTLQDIELGRLVVPPGVDLKAFVFSGGKSSAETERPRPTTVAALLAIYRQEPPPYLEESTRKMTEIHFRRIEEIISKRPLSSFDRGAAQSYIAARAATTYRGKPIQRETIEKELASFRLAWAWVASRSTGIALPSWTLKDLKFPKGKPVRNFMTWAEIDRTLARGGLSQEEQDGLWDCLWLDRDQTRELLSMIKGASAPPFLHPMTVAAAFTGARRSELCRSRIEDWDLEAGKGRIRQKKRDREVEFSFRDVPIHPEFKTVLLDWFSIHPGGVFAFAQPNASEVTWDAAAYHLRTTLAGTKWSVVKGWHVFRHSFASNLASAGVDQRLIDSWMGHSTEIRLRYQPRRCPALLARSIARSP